jgi:type II secretory pathway pseudopilin PulG
MTFGTAARRLPRRPRRRQEGYVLLALLLIVALMAIFALAVIVPIKFEIRREREQELIHRGVQYSRAIRNYYKKFGRYPTRLEDLDNTNNLRYLRKHYKDPVTGKDFKLLHYGDPGVTLTGSIGGGGIAGANTVGQMNASTSSSSGFGSGGSAFSQSSGFGGSSNSGFGGGSGGGFGGNSNSAFGGNSNSGFGSGSSSQTSSSQPGTNAASDGSQTVSQTPGTTSVETGSSTQQVFGGGPIVGVGSTSKEATIREFNKKKKYYEWQFVYDPTTDRGGLILTPNQPGLQLSGGQNLNGQPGSTNTSSSPFGQPSSFGNSNPGLMGNPTTPVQPPSNPPQLQ